MPRTWQSKDGQYPLLSMGQAKWPDGSNQSRMYGEKTGGVRVKAAARHGRSASFRRPISSGL